MPKLSIIVNNSEKTEDTKKLKRCKYEHYIA